MRVLRSFFLAIALVLCAGSLAAQTITLTTIESKPYWASDLPDQGFLVSVAREAFKRAGYTLDLRYVPFARALAEAKKGTYNGIFGFYYAKDREADFLFSEPLWSVEVVFLALKSRKIKYESLKDLSPYTIGVLNGADNGADFNGADYLKKDVVPGKASNVKKLLAGRIDLMVEIKDIALKLVAEEGNANVDLVEMVGKPLQVKQLFIGFAKANGDAATLKAQYDKAFLAMLKDGSYDKLREKFGFSKLAVSMACPPRCVRRGQAL